MYDLRDGEGMRQTISTIGYEGATLANFMMALRDASVDLLIDVRELPLSRKRGFSKNQLADALAAEGIEYLHLRGLGDPKEGRDAARAGNYARFRRLFFRHLESEVAQRDLDTAAGFVGRKRTCLMCYEADPDVCHRTIVADALSTITGLVVRALSVKAPERIAV